MPVDYAAAALAAARGYCGWMVTPPETVTITVDGPGGSVLSLPTLKLTTLTAVIEDGVALDVDDLLVSENRGLVLKKSGAFWSRRYAGITVTMTHGHAAAPDFDAAVEQAAKALSSAMIRDDPALTVKKVDDVQYTWAAGVQGNALNEALLAPYRILPSP